MITKFEEIDLYASRVGCHYHRSTHCQCTIAGMWAIYCKFALAHELLGSTKCLLICIHLNLLLIIKLPYFFNNSTTKLE